LIAILPFPVKVAQQRNGFDCGGFVCRAAYGVYRLRHFIFSFEEANYDAGKCNSKKLFKSFLVERPGFVRNKCLGDQNATDAAQRIRKEMMKLIQNLSNMYHQKKKQQRENEHKLLMLEKHDAGPTKAIDKDKMGVHKDMTHSNRASNTMPLMHASSCQAELFFGCGSGKRLESCQRVSLDNPIDDKQQQKKKKTTTQKQNYCHVNDIKHHKRSAKNRGKRRRTRLNRNVHPKKKNHLT
jgi:hypothetical protein